MSLFLLASTAVALAQTQPAAPPEPFAKAFVRDFWADQKHFVAAPFRMNERQFFGQFLPLAGGTAALTFGDPAAGRYPATRPDLQQAGRVLSWAGSGYTLAGLAAMGIFGGRATSSPFMGHLARNGLLALASSQVDVQAMKYAFLRERPDENSGQGRFWKGSDGFPSGHSMTAWAVATAIARTKGRKRWVAVTAYSAATAVSVARWMAWRHFPADIFAGGFMGFMMGNSIANRHPYTGIP